MVVVTTATDDGISRELKGLQIVIYDIPEGCVATYYPEANLLIPLWHHAERSKVPAAKSVPVRVRLLVDTQLSRSSASPPGAMETLEQMPGQRL